MRMRIRRLSILGGPVAGKTTLAAQHLRELLASRHEYGPVPVLVSVEDWDTSRFESLQEWLARRLGQDYPKLRAMGQELPEILARRQKYVLSVLDGLDTLRDSARASGIKQLNRSLAAEDQLVLGSRTGEELTETSVVTADRTGGRPNAALVRGQDRKGHVSGSSGPVRTAAYA
ncbi:NACHT domain-containing protein [Streptomyces sp. NPDC101150]|uniref:NACHT domain-containing protein n=1 Tax=Streptomyces sp. NPDC101150 TaxID=3366114 RepID=UPI003823FE6A